MSGLFFDRKDFGKLFIRLVFGIALAVKGVAFLVKGPSSLTLLGSILGIIGVTFFPLYLGWAVAVCHVVCGIMIAIGVFFKTSTFLFGTFFLLEAILEYQTGSDPIKEVAYPVMLAAVMYGFVFIGSGTYSIHK
ncbi:MAG: hypothetical protein LBD34_00840 [Puniceicoccales bacterium]|jgi:uncharacterized membrane protein YphA (DoxX/SURF4 family)|nr:hypothetical protein [Puniceicoccales bacterium]